MYMYNETFAFGNYEISPLIEFCKIHLLNNMNHFVMYSTGREQSYF